MNGNEQKETSESNPWKLAADVDRGFSFQLLGLRKTVKGAFGNGVAQ
ncbi:MAG TPA: hypothetical protein VMW38_27960 [Terriglobia bacterium]|nr:hypothetical protein [Terriglobia bacterium]